MKKTVLITGASTGIGRATAEYFQKKDWNVAATMRKPQEHSDLASLENIKCYELDVTKVETIQKATEESIRDFKKIDVVVNNAGYGLMGAFELATVDQVRRQFNTNLFGLMYVTKAFLPHFKQQRGGIFINISSIGGLTTFPLCSLYNSTKWAVEGFSEALNYELNTFGIKVRLIEPGGIHTDFGTRSIDWTSNQDIEDYNELKTKVQSIFQEMMNSEMMSSSKIVAETIFESAIDTSNRIRYLVGEDAKQMYKTRNEIGDSNNVDAMKQLFSI